MSNKKQTAVDGLVSQLQKTRDWQRVINEANESSSSVRDVIKEAKEMQQEQAQLYAMFVLMSVRNNLPPITFNDWVTNIRR
jgi:hypothetical protein